jgi:hypothetical protein
MKVIVDQGLGDAAKEVKDVDEAADHKYEKLAYKLVILENKLEGAQKHVEMSELK